jgi:hypothetical protein
MVQTARNLPDGLVLGSLANVARAGTFFAHRLHSSASIAESLMNLLMPANS